MKGLGDARKLHATLPIIATLGAVQRYRRLVTNPQQVRRWTRNGAIVPSILVAYFSLGQAMTRRQAATGEITPGDAAPASRLRPGRKARRLALLRPIWACVLVELLIGRREKISHPRAMVLALEPAVYIAVAQTLKRRESTPLPGWSVPGNPRAPGGPQRQGPG
jgi:hypothetical protein